MSEGMGYAEYNSRGIHNVGCIAQENGANGFNIEGSEGVTLSACRAGGLAAAGNDNYPHAADADLGNTGSGIIVNAASTKVLIEGCLSSYNGTGLAVTNASGARIVNSIFSNNTTVGINFVDDASALLSYVDPSTTTPNNGATDFILGTLGYINATHLLGAPAVPAGDTPLANPYPFEVVVYVVGVTGGYVMVDGAQPGPTNGVFMLKAGSTMQFGAPGAMSWTWWRA
jgi:hypothetical protein